MDLTKLPQPAFQVPGSLLQLWKPSSWWELTNQKRGSHKLGTNPRWSSCCPTAPARIPGTLASSLDASWCQLSGSKSGGFFCSRLMDEPKFVLKERYLCLHGFSLQSSTLTWTARHLSRSYCFIAKRLLLGSQKNNIFRKLKLVEKILISPPCATWQNLRASRDDSKSSAKETGVPLTNSWVTPLCASWRKSVGGADGSTSKKNREPQIWTHSCHWFKSLQRHSNYLKFIQKENQRQHPLLDILDAMSLSVNIFR